MIDRKRGLALGALAEQVRRKEPIQAESLMLIQNAVNDIWREISLLTDATGTGLSVLDTDPTITGLKLMTVPVYANNAAAVAGGLFIGNLYRTGADPDPLCIVH